MRSSCILHECFANLNNSSITLTTLITFMSFTKICGNVVNTLYQSNAPAARELTNFKKLNKKPTFMLTSVFIRKSHANFQNHIFVRNGFYLYIDVKSTPISRKMEVHIESNFHFVFL